MFGKASSVQSPAVTAAAAAVAVAAVAVAAAADLHHACAQFKKQGTAAAAATIKVSL